jgi:outer membrane murein-binding lipoprotein Lpp
VRYGYGVRVESPSWSKLTIACALLTFLGMSGVSASALGQGPVPEVQGPEPQPQRSEIDELKAKVKQLEQSVDDLKKKEQAAPEPLSSGTDTKVPAIDRERGLITEDSYADARLDNAPFDPALKGFFAIPGSHTMLRFGGYIRTDAIYDTSQLGNIFQLRPETIPTPNFDTSNFNLGVRASRLSFETRTNLAHDVIRTYAEIDFAGPTNAVLFRIRHLYGQWKNILIGQSWSTFHDSDVIPETADFNGPNSWIFHLNPQVRYTYALTKEHTISFAAEQPSSSIPSNNPVTAQPVSSTSPLPDFVVRYRHETDHYHFNTAGLFRSVGGVNGAGQSDHVFGYGVMASGLIRLWGRDNFVFQAVYGEGIARYFNDSKGLGLDAGYDGTGSIKAQPAYGGYAAIQHFWTDNWRSTITYGFLHISTTETSPANTYKQTQYLDGNLMYSPREGFTVGLGVIWGQRVNKDDVSGEGLRVNLLLKYDLVSLQKDLKKINPF